MNSYHTLKKSSDPDTDDSYIYCCVQIPYKLEGRRTGDLADVYCDPSLAANELKWKAEFGLEQMCADMWNWQSSNPNGYKQTTKNGV